MAITERLYQFDTKATLTPSDILYCGNSQDSFNEVQSTVAGLIGAYPGLLSIGGLTTAANEIIYTTAENTFATSGISSWGLALIDQAPAAHLLPITALGAGFNYVALSDGELLIGSTGNDPVAAPLTAGTGIAINVSAGGIEITATGAVSGAITTVVIQEFSASGTYTPTVGLEYCIVEVLGAGGGGGGSTGTVSTSGVGGGGGAGGYSRGVFDAATIGASQAVVIGVGGAGGAANVTGTAGTNTTFGALMQGNGGAGGLASTGAQVMAVGGVGGSASGGEVIVTGAHGNAGFNNFGAIHPSGQGADSEYGGGGSSTWNTNGNPATGFGAGGGGGSTQGGFNNTGGAGSDGYVIVTEYVNA